MKKIIFTLSLICACLLCALLFSHISVKEPETTTAEATTETTERETTAIPEATESPAVAFPETVYGAASAEREIELSCKNAAFYCVETKELLYSRDIDERIAPASLVKLLTAYVALFYVEPETEFTVGSELSLLKPHSSLCLIKKGHRLTLHQLLTGMLLPSGNDAAYTIAVNVARKVKGENLSDKEAANFFTELMNSFAEVLGIENSHFTSPDGWDDESQYTTVTDLLVLAQVALETETLREIVCLKEQHVVFKSGENITWENTNRLLHKSDKYYNSCAVGLKTGTSQKAGNCLVAAFKKNGLTYIAVICGSDTSEGRYEDAHKLLDTLM